MRQIAALFVATNGCYFGLPDVDPWDEARDARNYDGDDPVVAHPPCTRWCRLAGLVEARWGYRKGEDGGCFASALATVRRCGGVLEHPAYSDAWKAFGLNRPPRKGGWVKADDLGGWTCHVEQSRYGHAAKKATWLYANKPTPDSESTALISWCGNHTKSFDTRRRLGKREANATPAKFRDVLLEIARSVK